MSIVPGEQGRITETALQCANIQCATVAEAINATREAAHEVVQHESRLRIVSLANFAIFRGRMENLYTNDAADSAARELVSQAFDKAAMLFCSATTTGACAEAVLVHKQGRLLPGEVEVLKDIVEQSAKIVRLLGAETGLKLSLEMPQRICSKP